MGREKQLRGFVLVALVALVPCSAAFANSMPVTANIIQVTATSGANSATFSEVFPVSSFSGNLTWTLPAPLTLADGAVTLGTVKNMQVTFNADPQVDLNFAIVNGSTSTIMFDITTATILFDPVPNATAAATASVTLSQGAGSPAGASIGGLFPNGKVYQARYSTNAFVNTGTVFGSLAPSMSFSSGLGMSETEMLPAAGEVSLGTTAYMMESEFRFTLSRGDQASATSAFLITPEPASVLLLVLGGLVVTRRGR
jgi:hypothetical protein